MTTPAFSNFNGTDTSSIIASNDTDPDKIIHIPSA